MSKLGPLEHRNASPGCLEHVYCTAGKGYLVATCHTANTLDAAKYAELFANAPDVKDQRDDLLAACKAVDKSLLPYRGTDMSPDKAYLCSRLAITRVVAAIAKAEG